ncbi:MAG: Trk family potassium uptake protein [Candidatus Omnitrophica bacterium CG10_big_fil_rev_8_21_14_0_10_43_8]|nr:MAG: Trk family potassium uptake protein [Candidatus Omnitrophica bacterium CG10_big_fil_rev_8_21_14_0_10_43_8]
MIKTRVKPNHIIIFSFISASFIGALLLSMPFSIANSASIPFIDALFTASSAVCVTGLVVKNIGAFFSLPGQMIILTLIQLGGLGIMTFSTAFAIILGRRLTLKETVIMQNALDNQKVDGFRSLIKYILLVTFCIELIGAALLYTHWHLTLSYSRPHTLYTSIFHAVSAFCNAGFSLYPDNLAGFRSDVVVNMIITSLVLLGGIGFIVLLDLPKLKFWRKDRVKYFSKISLQSKLAITVTIALIILGMAGILFFEWNNTLQGMPLKEKLLCGYFHSVTPRTAGFNTLPVQRFTSPTLLINIGLMFIGASPGSTGGGIKTVTFIVLLAAAVAMLKNRNRVTAFKKTIPRAIFRRAFIIVLMGVSWIFLATIAICAIESSKLGSSNFALKNLFEVASAFGTVGLSTGITPALAPLSKLVIIFTMWIGRIGTLTLAFAIATSEESPQYIYPEERIMVG